MGLFKHLNNFCVGDLVRRRALTLNAPVLRERFNSEVDVPAAISAKVRCRIRADAQTSALHQYTEATDGPQRASGCVAVAERQEKEERATASALPSREGSN